MTTIRCLLEEAASISKQQPGIIQGERLLLFSEWHDRAQAVATLLRASGVKPGDRVALFMPNDWRMLVALMGIFRAGAIACPLSTRLPRAAVIEQIRQVAASVVVARLSDEAREALRDVTVFDPDQLAGQQDPGDAGPARIDLDAPAAILFTSGSCGQPKPALLTYGNFYYNAQGANANLRLRSNDRWLLQLPLYHVGGLGVLFRCLAAGASVVIPEQGETLDAALARYQPTHVSVVPTQLGDLLVGAPPEAADAVRVYLVGGAAADAERIEAARRRGWPVYLTYGMTEMASQITTVPPDAPPSVRFSTSGKLLRHRKLMLAGDGEILVKGPCLFSGYWSGDRVVSAVDEQGWFHTGDLGRLDDQGYLTVLGRKDALIISGGENIQPEEVERAMMALAGMECVVVVPMPHPRFGQRPVAFVKASKWDEPTWRKRLLQLLPAFKIPDYFYPWPEQVPADGKAPRSTLARLARGQAT
mgnify:CR=1 FL=1